MQGIQKDQILVRRVIDACNYPEILSISEGVKTKEQRKLLGQAQGFLFRCPMPVEVFEHK